VLYPLSYGGSGGTTLQAHGAWAETGSPLCDSALVRAVHRLLTIAGALLLLTEWAARAWRLG
jgi:hypothetical protein